MDQLDFNLLGECFYRVQSSSFSWQRINLNILDAGNVAESEWCLEKNTYMINFIYQLEGLVGIVLSKEPNAVSNSAGS